MSERHLYEIVADLQDAGLRLGLRGGKRITVTGPEGALTPELLAELREAHQATLRDLARLHDAGGRVVPTSSRLPDLERRRTRPTTAIF